MNRKMLIIIALQAFIMVVLFWMLVFYGKDEFEAGGQEDEEVISSPSLVSNEDGAAIITLEAKAQEQSGIATTTLVPASHRGEITSFGEVLPIDTLIEQRTAYLAALAEAEVVRASLANTRQEYERLQHLNADAHNVSDRAVAAAQAAWKADEAKLAASNTSATNWRDAMRQQWGAVLTQWATQKQPPGQLQRLLQHDDVLLQITIPFSAPALTPDTPVQVAPAGSEGNHVRVSFVSPSPRVDSTLQGRTYFYHGPAANLRAGMRLNVKLQTQRRATTGFYVPDSAVVWFANQSWIYQKQGADKFIRRPISTQIEAPQGWFNAESDLKAGDEIVTTGAQLLLSEEFKFQIKNENED